MRVHPVLLGFVLVGCSGKVGGSSGNGADDSGAAGEDADNDGYGVGVDCNDGNASIHPDAEEVCDGVDNDCVDGVDVGATDATDYFVDDDADGYGAGAPTASCDPLAGQVTNDEDCDDSNAAAHPGAAEVCGDVVDEDCDGEAPSCRYSGEVDPDDADAHLEGETLLGYDMTPAGDMNGDGVGDLAVGLGDYDADGFGVFLYYGPISGTIEPAAVSAKITNESAGDGVGFDLRGIGDQDGDGYDDLIITGGLNKASAAAGGVYVVLGPITGTHPVDEIASAMIAGETSNGVGWYPSAGDVNDDGIVDLMVGAPGTNLLTGAAYVFYGPLTSGDLTTASDADASFTGWHTGDFTGGCNAANGDIDGDGVDDVLVSAEQSDQDEDDGGAAYLFYGPVGGAYSVRDADATFIGGPPGRHLGWFSSIGGDLDGDGLHDVGLTAPYGYVDGSVYIVYGDEIAGASEIDVSKTGAIVWGTPGSYQQLGYYIDTAGDLDSDGKDDLAIGSWVSDGYNGTAWVFYGPISGEVHAYEASFVVPGDFAQGMGASTVFVGDVSGDDIDDLGIGANYTTVDDVYGSGTVFLFDGTP